MKNSLLFARLSAISYCLSVLSGITIAWSSVHIWRALNVEGAAPDAVLFADNLTLAIYVQLALIAFFLVGTVLRMVTNGKYLYYPVWLWWIQFGAVIFAIAGSIVPPQFVVWILVIEAIIHLIARKVFYFKVD